ncbi:AAA domain-containing protein [Nitrospira tepida]|uniref:AAA domain-containing protein n=1 Tax=Nitrospira tepida TaxID=2973512 RepID=UPI00259C9C9A|nr:AAA domain-containing protein [Nitrospira tepida]
MALRDPVQERVVSTYIRRLLGGVGRSAILRAFPTRTVKRIDLARLRIAGEPAPEELVQGLVKPEGRYRLVFRHYREPGERGKQSQALFTTLRTKLAREAQAAHRETGLWMLWLAYPLLYVPHPSAEHDEYLLAPLFLWPIKIESGALPEGEVLLTRQKGAPRFNRIAWQWIRRNLDFDPPEPTGHDLLELASFDDLRRLVGQSCGGFRPVLNTRLGPSIEAVPERNTLEQVNEPKLFDAGIVGLIQWENMELLADLEKLHGMEELEGPAGDVLRERERPQATPLQPPPEVERFLVTDSDHTQEIAIWMARRPEGAVIHGPPGTGKSQVIVNIVADTLARGEKALVVCQKKAALDVVATRLRKVGLGELFIQVDDAESDRRRVIEMLRDQEQLVLPYNGNERTRIAQEIERIEKEFQEYATALFHVRERHGVSYRTMLARIARIEREHPDVRPLAGIREILKHTNDTELCRLLEALKQIEGLFWEADVPNNPWLQGREDLTGDRYQLEQIEGDLERAVPVAEKADEWAGQQASVGGELVGSLEAIRDAAERLAQLWPALDSSVVSEVIPPKEAVSRIEDIDYRRIARAVERVIAKQGSLFRIFSRTFYRDRQIIRNFVERYEWSKDPLAGEIFHRIAEQASAAAACEIVLKTLGKWFKDSYVNSLCNSIRTGSAAAPCLRRLKEYLPRLPILLRYLATVSGLDQRGREVVGALETASAGIPRNWPKVVELSALLAWVGNAERDSPILRRLTPELYDANRTRLVDLVKQKRGLESQAIRAQWASKWPTIDHRWRRGLRFRGPRSQRLREIVETGAGRGLFDLRPCWLVNPGTASQIFPLRSSLFDVVIFDEASQCPPEYALPALYRGRRTAVAGDGKQLPPTMFFKAAFDFDIEEDGEGETHQNDGERQAEDQMDIGIASGADDLLSLAQARLPDAHLNVHYRSLDPVLIAFSNAAFYRNRLESPEPAVRVTQEGGAPALFIERVDGVYQADRTNPDEARRVAAFLKQLWQSPRNRPTVGVVTFNEAQRETIEDLLETEAARDTDFRLSYERELTRVEDGEDVGFFVKSLEAVQGDERDVILFSTTYGRRTDGRFIRSTLGPINRQGGERRLNVAITRAKRWVRIFTSLPVHELASALTPGAVETADAAGRAMLQLYLAYAEHIAKGEREAALAILGRALELSGGLEEHRGPVGAEESEFEIEVREALCETLDLEIDPQVSSGSFRIDLGIRAPDGGGYILGVECDGKAYHSAPSARAYDYWRQAVLEQRGWRIHRIWSTAWRNDRAREIHKVEQRITKILQSCRS